MQALSKGEAPVFRSPFFAGVDLSANWPIPIDLIRLAPATFLPRREWPVSKTPEILSKPASNDSGHIYIGVGGWTFAPWRGVFYPEKLTQAKELEYAASKLTSIEINGTYYGSQKPESFRNGRARCPTVLCSH
jgi:hypothetical protein